MTYTIRDNNGNVVFSVENVNPEVSYESIDNSLKDLTEYSNKLNKSIEAFNLISNTRAMESFGYRATEGFGEKVKTAGKAMWEKIKEYAKKVVSFLVKIFQKIKKIVMAPANKKVLLKAQDIILNEARYNKDLDNPTTSQIIKFINSEKMNILTKEITEKYDQMITNRVNQYKEHRLGGGGIIPPDLDSKSHQSELDEIKNMLKKYKELTDKNDSSFFKKKIKDALSLITTFDRALTAVKLNIDAFNNEITRLEDGRSGDPDSSSMQTFKELLDYSVKYQNNLLEFIVSCWKSVKNNNKDAPVEDLRYASGKLNGKGSMHEDFIDLD